MSRVIEGTAVEVKGRPETREPVPETRHVHQLDSSLYVTLRMAQKAEAFDQIADLWFEVKVAEQEIAQLEKKRTSGANKYEKDKERSFLVTGLEAKKKALLAAVETLIVRHKPLGV